MPMLYPPVPPEQPAPQIQPPPQLAPSVQPAPQSEPESEAEVAEETEPESSEPESSEPESSEPESPEPESPEPGVGPAFEEIPSEEELNAMLGPPEAELESVDSLIDSGEEGAADGDYEPIDPDNIPDPEPIPESLSAPQTSDDDEEPAGGANKFIIIGVVALVVILLGAGLFYGRGLIVSMWPGANNIFSMIGLSGDSLGAGLDIRNVKSERETKGDGDILVIRGIVSNVVEEPRMVPLIRVSLYNSDGVVVQSKIVVPTQTELKPKAIVRFMARLENPPAGARRLEVTFTRPDSMSDKDK